MSLKGLGTRPSEPSPASVPPPHEDRLKVTLEHSLPGTHRPSTAMLPACLLLGKFWGMSHRTSRSPSARSFCTLRNWSRERAGARLKCSRREILGEPAGLVHPRRGTGTSGRGRLGRRGGKLVTPQRLPPRSPSACGHTPAGSAAPAERCPQHRGTRCAGKRTHGCWERPCCGELWRGWARWWDAAARRCPCVCVCVRVSAG